MSCACHVFVGLLVLYMSSEVAKHIPMSCGRIRVNKPCAYRIKNSIDVNGHYCDFEFPFRPATDAALVVRLPLVADRKCDQGNCIDLPRDC